MADPHAWWKALVAMVLGSAITLLALRLFNEAPPFTLSPMWRISDVLALLRPNDAAGATTARSGRAHAPLWTLRGSQPPSTQEGSLMHGMAMLMRGLQQYPDAQQLYDLDDHTKAILRSHQLHPQVKSSPAD